MLRFRTHKGSVERDRSSWMRRATDRPSLAIDVCSLIHERYPLTMQAMPLGRISPEDINTGLFLEDCERLYQIQSEIPDDFPFIGSPLDYVPWMEAIMGCRVKATPTSIWAEPYVDDWEGWHWRRPSLDNPWAMKLLELMRALVEGSDGRYPVGPTLMRGPSDMLVGMRGGGKVPLDFNDYPELMSKVLDLCADVWIEVGKAQHRLIPDCDRGYMSRSEGLHFWAPERTIWLQADAVSLLSPKIYRRFLLPVDRRIAAEFPAVAYHLHSTALWAVDEVLLIPEVSIVELNFEEGDSCREAAFAACKRILADKGLIVYRSYSGDFWPWLDRVLTELPAEGLAIEVVVPKLEDGKEVSRRFMDRVSASRVKQKCELEIKENM